jgi:hypothetical protein
MNPSIVEISLQPPQTPNVAVDRTKRLAVSNLSRERWVRGNSKSSSDPRVRAVEKGDILRERVTRLLFIGFCSFPKIATAASHVQSQAVFQLYAPISLLFKVVTT